MIYEFVLENAAGVQSCQLRFEPGDHDAVWTRVMEMEADGFEVTFWRHL